MVTNLCFTSAHERPTDPSLLMRWMCREELEIPFVLLEAFSQSLVRLGCRLRRSLL